MENRNIAIKRSLAKLYYSFEESLRDAFVSAMSGPNTGRVKALPVYFQSRAEQLRKRYFILINDFVLLADKDSGYEELERFSRLLKVYIDEDITMMQRNAKRFAIRIHTRHRSGGQSLEMAITREQLKVLNESREYRLDTLGKITKRLV